MTQGGSNLKFRQIEPQNNAIVFCGNASEPKRLLKIQIKFYCLS
ncbi:hypothetical protein CAMGR0001_2648 [Campylobacter gracilis RM3268]|uniref:Uncharacterized protein n=1 Tax=Campylobacter gracilis RM3268 TaxID=553220 RepID=C8PF08_9BACT|nr:hypothetical protein CAMGR0001_2648 [Campylobacter gracilis RM3268]